MGSLNQDGLIALIAEEVAGNTDWLYSRQQVRDLDEAIEYLEGELEGIEDEIKLLEIDKKLDGRQMNKETPKTMQLSELLEQMTEQLKIGSDLSLSQKKRQTAQKKVRQLTQVIKDYRNKSPLPQQKK